MSSTQKGVTKPVITLAKNANRILFIRNLPFGVDGEELFDLFFRYGQVQQIRLGCTPATSTTAYVVYENVVDAQNAKEALNGFTMRGRYLIVQYFRINTTAKK